MRVTDIKKIILEEIAKKGQIKVSDIVNLTGFSRVYIHRFFRELQNEGKIYCIGKANRAYYVLTEDKKTFTESKVYKVHRILQNKNLEEDRVLNEIKKESNALINLPLNIDSIFSYTFTEILNNAIEHSQTDIIDIVVERTTKDLSFKISDRGIGIFNNIMAKKGLKNHLEAIQDLLKGKETTAPAFHSGEGIYFTSKLADRLNIKSSRKHLIFDNIISDIFIKDINREISGTKVFFTIGLDSKKEMEDVFARYTDDTFEFNKTGIKVKLFKEGVDYISRSQARRILVGLEKFKSIELDFSGIKTIGQGFADEIFRVWKSHHPDINITIKNANENTLFMIKHVTSDLQLVNNFQNLKTV